MTATLTAVYERHDDWFIGYVEELPGVNIQEATLEEARENLLKWWNCKERASETVDFLCLSSFSPWEKSGDEGRNVQLYLTFKHDNGIIPRTAAVLVYSAK